MKKKEKESMTILVIDDDDRVRALIKDILLFGGFQVIEASDGKTGVTYLEEGERVQMVLTDLGMPGMNGWDVVKAIKSKTPQIPVALITGWGVNLDEERIEESGVDWIIGKPFQVNDILETVRLFIKN